MVATKNLNTAVFAGGCFWCIEAAFEKLSGVVEVLSGYTGGKAINPTSEQVSSGTTGHYEAIQITYDSQQISYQQLLNRFWKNIDPFDSYGQFVDKGSQYLTAIFYGNETERKLAEKSKQELQLKFSKPIATKILPLREFYLAEDYHQDFYKKNPLRYRSYSENSGRKERLKEVWEE